ISPQSRADFQDQTPTKGTVPPPTRLRNASPNDPPEPTSNATTTTTTVGTTVASTASEETRPRKINSATDKKTSVAKPPVNPNDAPPEPTDVAAKPGVKLRELNSSMMMQDPDTIRKQIASDTAPTLTINYSAFIRSGEEAVAFAGTPDETSFKAIVTN